MKISIITRPPRSSKWTNNKVTVKQIPAIGEHITTSDAAPWFRVIAVVHTLFPCEIVAEVYAVEITPDERSKLILPQ